MDGLGFDIIKQYSFQGDLQTLFGSDSTVVPGYMLGDKSSVHNGTNGVIFLVEFADVQRDPTFCSSPTIYSSAPQTGLFLASFWMGDELNSTLARLEKLGLGGKPHIASFGFGTDPFTTYATVRDPDGTRLLLTSRPYVNAAGERRP